MKLNSSERRLINKRRKFIKIKRNSEKITKYRKSSTQSSGERVISNFLVRECIDFKTEWYFNGLYNYSKSSLLYFDFYIPEYNLCIEYDGEQHYSNKKTERQKINDFIKNAYCLKNGINFLRIKYTEYDNIQNIIIKKVDDILSIK